eukprot:1136582-Pelagomonas_calceolata.AAC.3
MNRRQVEPECREPSPGISKAKQCHPLHSLLMMSCNQRTDPASSLLGNAFHHCSLSFIPRHVIIPAHPITHLLKQSPLCSSPVPNNAYHHHSSNLTAHTIFPACALFLAHRITCFSHTKLRLPPLLINFTAHTIIPADTVSLAYRITCFSHTKLCLLPSLINLTAHTIIPADTVILAHRITCISLTNLCLPPSLIQSHWTPLIIPQANTLSHALALMSILLWTWLTIDYYPANCDAIISHLQCNLLERHG